MIDKTLLLVTKARYESAIEDISCYPTNITSFRRKLINLMHITRT